MNGEDDKYRSRKWIMACRVFWTATIQHGVLQLLALLAMMKGKLDADTWATAAQDLGMVWVWAAGAVLALYGLANVASLKFRTDAIFNGGGGGK